MCDCPVLLYVGRLIGSELLALKEGLVQVDLPVMTVAVERAVKEVMTKCSDMQERDGLVFQTTAARIKNPYSDWNRLCGGVK